MAASNYYKDKLWLIVQREETKMTDKDSLPEKDNGPWNRIIHELRYRLDDLTAVSHHTNREIKDIQNSMHELSVKQHGQLTPEQIVAFSTLLLMKERKTWLFGRLRFYTVTMVGVIAGIFVFRIWIADVFSVLAKLFKAS
jgi:hypothetical protein